MIEEVFSFQSPNRYQNPRSDEDDSKCRVRFYPMVVGPQRPEYHVIVAKEIEDNPGMSITNSWEVLGPQLTDHFGLRHGAALFIEHYAPDSYPDLDEDKRAHDVTIIDYDAKHVDDDRKLTWYASVKFRPIGSKDFRRGGLPRTILPEGFEM